VDPAPTPAIPNVLRKNTIKIPVLGDKGKARQVESSTKASSSKQPTPKGKVPKKTKNKRKAKAASLPDPLPDQLGPETVSFDCFKLRTWHLLTMAGFYTYPHHDSDGLCTWVTMQGGVKIWGIRRLPREPATVSEWSLLQEKYLKGQSDAIPLEFGDIFNLFLCPGSVL
jgi:hypothetical protein